MRTTVEQKAREAHDRLAAHDHATKLTGEAISVLYAAYQAWRDVGNDYNANACEHALRLIPGNTP
jgi:hypothetical protein